MKLKFNSYKDSKFLEIFTFIYIVIGIIAISIYVSFHNTNQIIEKYQKSSIFYTVLFLYICYSIPFLWNVYEKILNIKEYISESDIQNLLTTEYYNIRLNNYYIYLQYPIILFIFTTLFIMPLLDFLIEGIYMMLLALYFFFIPQIYQFSIHVSHLSFKNFLKNERADSYNTQKVFKELWKKSEHFLLKIFSLEEKDIFDIYTKKVNKLIKTNHFDRLNNLLNDFYNYINYRNELFLINNSLLYFLDFHFNIWNKNKKSNIDIKNSLNLINSIVENIEIVSLLNKRNTEFNMFINKLKMHIEYIKYKHSSKFNSYLKYLIQSFSFTLFRNINTDYKRFRWSQYFPEEWKISIDKIKKQKIIPLSLFDNFTKFISNHFVNIDDEFEKGIKKIINGIFKNCDANLLMRLLFFVLSKPFSNNNLIEENIENLIINLDSFEIKIFNIDEEKPGKTAKNQITEYENISEKNTYKFMDYMFPEQFESRKIDLIIDYLQKLKNQYQNKPSTYYNIETYINILIKIKNTK